MPYEVLTDGFHDDLVSWCQQYVGDLLWSRPNVEWKGQGWTINAYGFSNNRNRTFYMIKLEDRKLATFAELRWGTHFYKD